MKMIKNITKPINNSGGFLTAEFIFSMVISVGLCAILFVLNFTLSMAEVAQYVAFSSARAFSAGHITQELQNEMARSKYQELFGNPALKGLFSKADGSWFQVSPPDQLEISSTGFSDYGSSSGDRMVSVGVRFNFQSKILNLRIPFLGSTAEDPDVGYHAKITGFLLREPTHEECWNQMRLPRYEAVLNGSGGQLRTLAESKKNDYVPMEDNGC